MKKNKGKISDTGSISDEFKIIRKEVAEIIEIVKKEPLYSLKDYMIEDSIKRSKSVKQNINPKYQVK